MNGLESILSNCPWPVAAVRRLFKVVNGGTPTTDQENWDGGVIWLTPEDLGKLDGGKASGSRRTLSLRGVRTCNATLVPPGSLVLSTRAPIGYVVELPLGGTTNQGCRSLVPKVDLVPRYFQYQFRAARSYLEARGQSTTFSELSTNDLASARIVIPPLKDQQAIVLFLDTVTARIDELNTKKRYMLSIFTERVVSASEYLILGAHAGDCKPSRMGWFRTVPTGWAETQLRHLNCDVQTGPFGSQLHADDYVDDGWPVVNPMNLATGRLVRVPGMEVSDETRTALSRHILRRGDIVLGRRGELGRAALVEPEHEGWLCGTGSLRLRLRGTLVEPRFLKLLLETRALRNYFVLHSIGSTMENLNSNIVLAAPVLIPPMEEQLRIVAMVEDLRAQYGRANQLITRQIMVLQEYRQALITAAVVGQVEVAGVAA